MDRYLKAKNQIMQENRRKMLAPAKPKPGTKPRKKKTPMYKAYGGKIDDKNYASCGAKIVRTK